MKKYLALAILLVSWIGLGGCDSNSNPVEPGPDIVQDDSQEGLAQYRARWAATQPSLYEFSVFRRCVCFENLVLYTVVVEDGMPISATRTSSTMMNEPVPVENVPYPTIDSLFDLVQSGFEVEADSIGARYVVANGRLDQLTIDFFENIADDEVNVFVEAYEELN